MVRQPAADDVEIPFDLTGGGGLPADYVASVVLWPGLHEFLVSAGVPDDVATQFSSLQRHQLAQLSLDGSRPGFQESRNACTSIEPKKTSELDQKQV